MNRRALSSTRSDPAAAGPASPGGVELEHGVSRLKVVQGIDRKWKWSVRLQEGRRHGEARVRDNAITAAKTAIDRALEPKKVRLQPR